MIVGVDQMTVKASVKNYRGIALSVIAAILFFVGVVGCFSDPEEPEQDCVINGVSSDCNSADTGSPTVDTGDRDTGGTTVDDTSVPSNQGESDTGDAPTELDTGDGVDDDVSPADDIEATPLDTGPDDVADSDTEVIAEDSGSDDVVEPDAGPQEPTDCGADLWDGVHGGDNPWDPFEIDCGDLNASWDCERAQAEEELLELINEQRSEVRDCGGVEYGPSEPLEMHPAVQCAARIHGWDMGERGYTGHDTPEGTKFGTRMSLVGASYMGRAENISYSSTPQGAISGWMNSPAHCRNLMCGSYQDAGIGHYGSSFTLKVGGFSTCM